MFTRPATRPNGFSNTITPRRIGLSRDNGTKLLRTVGNKPHANDDDHDNQHAAPSPAKRRKKAPSPVDIDASPEASSDINRSPASSDNDEDAPSQFDIKSSWPKQSASPEKKTGPRPQRTRPSRPDTDGTDESTRRKPSILPEVPDWMVESERQKKKGKRSAASVSKPRTTYGVKSATIKKELKGYSDLEAVPTSRTFKIPGELPSPRSSKSKSPSSRSRNPDSQGSDEPFAGAEEHLTPEEIQGVRLATKAIKHKKVKEDISSSEDAPPSSGGFKVPETLTQAIDRIDDDEDIRAARAHQDEIEKEEAERAAKLPDEGKCPMHCGKILPRKILETLSPGASIREQQAFCRRHQVVDAKKEWKKRKYPTIDWNRLPERLEEDHDDNIHHLLFFPDALHFRKLMEERIQSGKSRTLLQQHQKADLDYLGAGYYGLKGQEMITTYIGKHFASSVSKRAELDPVMSAQGPMAYVQEVLVLEVVTLLIKEDMKCDDVKARKIMAESTYIGEVLWPSESASGAKRRTRRLANEEQD